MANVFPDQSSGANFGSHVQVFADAKCTQLAPVTVPTTGIPYIRSLVPVLGGVIQPFASTLTTLYALNNAGTVVTFYPHMARTMATVTGSKGGNAALTSLMAALAGQGLVTDTTT